MAVGHTALTGALDAATVERYLARIGHAPLAEPDLDALGSLQDAHVRTVPFENLDIHLGEPLSLDLDDLVAKVVLRRRGGFCYELNGLFCALLCSLGYRARLVEARTRTDDGGLGPRFDHARILVTVAEGEPPVLVDVGTGASPRGPIRLEPRPQRIGHEWYRVLVDADRYESQAHQDGAWTSGWVFDTTPRTLADFTGRCRYHQTSPDSHFTHKPLATLVTSDGHIRLADRALAVVSDGQRHEHEVDDPLAVLAQRFGLHLPRWPGS